MDVQELVNDAFLAVDEQLAVALQQGRASGCTAIMAYIRKEGNDVRIRSNPHGNHQDTLSSIGTHLPNLTYFT